MRQTPRPIRDNPSQADLRRRAAQLESLRALKPLFALLGDSGRKAAQTLEEMPDMAAQAERLTSMPDRFNEVFVSRCWVATEDVNYEVYEHAIAVARSRGVNAGEAVLVDYWSPDEVQSHLRRFWVVNASRARARLLGLALDDYRDGRYHACIPLVLAQLDGIVDELGIRNVFSRDHGSELVAPDSISAHPGALPRLYALIGRGYKGGLENTLVCPNRHAILHGANVAYDTRTLAAKTWAALFAVRDYAVKRQVALAR